MIRYHLRTSRTYQLYSLVWSDHYSTEAIFNRTNSRHMTTSVSQRLHILYIMLKIIASFVITLFDWSYVRINILITCGRHCHDRIISLRGEIWAKKKIYEPHNISLKCLCQTRKVRGHVFVFEVSERSCICVRGK